MDKGADVQHPAPGAEGRPSFTAVVGSVDQMASKYVAANALQVGRQELIDDLKTMVKVRVCYCYSLFVFETEVCRSSAGCFEVAYGI